jgi:predicted N-formylglutamate amidohydrolase
MGAMSLLSPSDPPPVEVINPQGSASIVFVSDHDANTVPAALGTLGLDPGELDRHIGYDIGIARIARRLATRFDAPLIASRYSRLICDLNRRPHWPSSIPMISDGTVVPGNQELSAADRQSRYDALFTPYHSAISDVLDQRDRPLFVALHSFTPVQRADPTPRPWEIGFLWSEDEATSARALAIFREMFPDIPVGANQPYSGFSAEGYTVPIHAERRGLPNLCLEFRQDLIADDAGGDLWADRFADALDEIWRDDARPWRSPASAPISSGALK